MANIPLQSIIFPGLPNIYDAPTMEGIGKGIFPELIAGGLVDLDSYVEDSDPYLFATMPQGAGKVLNDELVGAKVAWNQLLKPLASNGGWSIEGGVTATFSDGVASISSTIARNGIINAINWRANHKYLLAFDAKASSDTGVLYGTASGSVTYIQASVSGDNQWHTFSSIKSAVADCTVTYIYGLSANYNIQVRNAVVIDLTQMLGSTTADYIYSLEQATAGAGVAFFTKYFGNGYRAYDAGSLQGALVSGHKTIGVNQWDEVWELGGIDANTGQNYPASARLRSKNHIPALPNTTYYFHMDSKYSVTGWYGVMCYDSDKNYIDDIYPYVNNTFTTLPNTAYIRFFIPDGWDGQTYNRGICVNISNADINGKYYPYEEHTYDIEPEDLNGVFVLDNGELKADGDVRRADGSKAVRYGEVDLGELDWVYYTGGTNPIFQATVSDMVNNLTSGTNPKIVCPKYNVAPVNARSTFSENEDNSISIINGNNVVLVRNTSYTDADVFKTAMSGRKLVYPLATPTEDTAEPFEEYQACKPYGTEQYILDDSQIVPIPAGHNTKYFEDPLANIMARLDALENA